jgi:hypothetical protein
VVDEKLVAVPANLPKPKKCALEEVVGEPLAWDPSSPGT